VFGRRHQRQALVCHHDEVRHTVEHDLVPFGMHDVARGVHGVHRASDDIAHQLGDPQENMVKIALDYLAGRGCTPISGGGITTQGVSGREVLYDDKSPSTVRRDLPGAF